MIRNHYEKRSKLTIALCIALLAMIFTTCKEKEFQTSTEGRLNVFLTGLSIDYASHMRGLNLQKFKFLTGQKNSLEKTMNNFSSFIFSKNQRDTVSGWQSNLTGINDRFLRRQVELLSKFYLINTIEYQKLILGERYKVLDTLVNSRIIYNGESLSLSQMCKKTFNAESADREKIYSKIEQPITALKKHIIDLIKIRNDAVKKAGFTDYPSLVFYIEEIDPEMMDKLLTEIEVATAPIYKNYLTQRSGSPPVFYQDISRIFSPDYEKKIRAESLSDMTETTALHFKQIGVTPSGKIKTAQSSAVKGSNGFTVSIPNDYRIILSQISSQPEFNKDFIYNFALGEYYTHLYDTKTLLLGFSNAMGTSSRIYRSMIGNLLPLIIQKNARQKEDYDFRKTSAFEIYILRKQLMMADFEWTLYADPDLDPDKLLRELAEKYLMISEPGGLELEWAVDYLLIEEPLGYAMNIAGAAASYQIFATIQRTLKPAEKDLKKYGEWLQAYIFRYGELYPWHKKIIDISGRPLQTDDLINYFQNDLR